MTDRRAARLALDLTEIPRSVTLTRNLAQNAPGINGDPWIDPSWLASVLPGRDPGEVLRPLLVYHGATVANQDDYQAFHAKPEVADRLGMFHATARLWDRRTSIRYSPPACTPFTVAPAGDRLAVWANGDRVAEGVLLEPESACLRNLTYYSNGRAQASDVSISINPIQSCPLRCKFCRRQYDHLDRTSEALINLTPAQTADHLVLKYGDVDWSSLIQVSIVTGTFATFDHMIQWVEGFTREMYRATGGQWDPAATAGQNIHILSHLARSREQMLRLRAAGVKTYQDTAEVVDDSRRRELMPKANPRNTRLAGKGDLPWRSVLESVSHGRDVFGETGYSVTLILGLDTVHDTLTGLSQLLAEGLVMLDRPVYQAFEEAGLELYAMDGQELVEVNMAAGRLFRTVSTDWDPSVLVAAERVSRG